ncbi:hypothetical protein EJB05_51443 [Eragrostis curvula]|uniref:Uncharacterized protein n=1 Tax=Eragrostis curvula TaxID=38414 RepID=A0A5J9SVP1_9POAL|nr:hypothetical protein EJB05_51443 [Eragrostis curvula]
MVLGRGRITSCAVVRLGRGLRQETPSSGGVESGTALVVRSVNGCRMRLYACAACGQVFSCRMYIDAAALGQEQPCSLSHLVESAVVSHVDGYRFCFRCCLVEFLSGSTSQGFDVRPLIVECCRFGS